MSATSNPSSRQTASDGADLAVERSGPEAVRLVLRGRFDADGVAPVWDEALREVQSQARGSVQIDASGVSYCDGAGIGLFTALQRAAGEGVQLELLGLSSELQQLVELATVDRQTDRSLAPPGRVGFVTQFGRSTSIVLADMKAIVSFVGELALALLWAVRHPRKVRYGDMWVVAEKLGVNAVPVVCLLGWLVGLIIAFQAAIALSSMGLVSFIPMLVTIAMVRELGPLMTAIILAGRSGSAFAAEIGTMKVTEELNALDTFGLDPTRFLVVPRVLAALIMTPLLSLFATLMGLLGGYMVMASEGYTFAFYVSEVTAAADYVDLLQGVFKALIFALLVAAIGCLRGLLTQSGPGAVGDSTTKAVVAGIVLVVIADSMLGVVFYYVGI